MGKIKVISIDHGNRHIKTGSHIFPASFVESGYLPSIGKDTIDFDGKEYALADQRMPQKNDKTIDNSYYILTLFAIGKELVDDMDSMAEASPSGNCTEITLLIGLPPQHCKEMAPSFAKYFKRDVQQVSFQYNKVPILFKIANVCVYPQAYAAALTVSELFEDSVIANIIDIGGFTVDLLQLVDGSPNMSMCSSQYFGVNLLFERINDQVRAKTTGKIIPDLIIENLLRSDEKTLRNSSVDRVELVKSTTKQFARDILLKVSDKGVDLEEDSTIFVGGGSTILREYIEKSGMVKKPIFADDIHANANGYRIIYDDIYGA